jgi:hypothetical protein
MQLVQHQGRIAKRRDEQQHEAYHRRQTTDQESQQIGLTFRLPPQAACGIPVPR